MDRQNALHVRASARYRIALAGSPRRSLLREPLFILSGLGKHRNGSNPSELEPELRRAADEAAESAAAGNRTRVHHPHAAWIPAKLGAQ